MTARIRNVAPKHLRTYGNRVYHSKAEMVRAQELDILKAAGKIVQWIPQYRFRIMIGQRMICTVVADFWVQANDGSWWAEEIKGFETEVYKLKRKLLLACYPNLDYRVIKV